jgi:hypothetical protein
MQGDVYSTYYECFFKIETVKEMYRKEVGYCKLAPDATVSTLKFTGVEATTVKDCKAACDQALLKCWGFQFLKKESIPADRSISQCTLFDEWLKDLQGDESTNVDCYIQERTT